MGFWSKLVFALQLAVTLILAIAGVIVVAFVFCFGMNYIAEHFGFWWMILAFVALIFLVVIIYVMREY